MPEDIKQRFQFVYESSAQTSYLVMKASADEKVQNYQVEMIANNPDPGILPFDVRQKDDSVNLYYNITSKLALSQFLKRKKLKRDEFISILDDIVKLLLDCKSYLLSDKSLFLDEDYIYINPNTLKVSAVYIPIPLEGDSNQNLKEFIIKLIMFTADIDDSSTDNFIQRILGNVKADTFNMTDFSKLLIELKTHKISKPHSSGTGRIIVEIPDSVSDGGMTQFPNEVGKDITGKEAGRTEIPQKQPQKPAKPNDKSGNFKKNTIPAVPPSAQKPVSKGIQTSKTEDALIMQYSQSIILITAASQVLILAAVIAFFVLYKSGDLISKMGLVLIAGALDFLLLRSLLDKKNMVPKIVEKKAASVPKASPVNMAKRELRNTPNAQEDVATGRVVKKEMSPQPGTETYYNEYEPSKFNATADLRPENYNDTVILTQPKQNSPYLQSQKDGIVEKIPVTKSEFIIGRLRGSVDYISQNNAVGKVHAEIITRDDQYFVKDLNSRNGTYINGNRIDSNKEYVLKNHDKITFANSDYIFIVP